MTDLLTLDGVEAGFGGRAVLHGIDLSVAAGSAVGIFGLNGAGKSVTMKVVAGLVPARSGRATFAGRDITRLQTEDRMRLGMAYVPQGRQLFPDLTVEQNLRLGSAVLRRRDPARAAAAVRAVYERFPRLDERRTQSAGSMSGGEQAMLAIGRALAGAPQLLLVDEPSAGLAPTVVESVFEMLQALRSEGLTILLVEQNISLGFRLVDRAVILQTGRVVYDDVVSTLDTTRVAELLGVGRLLGRGLEAAAKRPKSKRSA
ncbi:MAG: ABC transporter ATP-binding protein [Acidimicrobiales bacterium]